MKKIFGIVMIFLLATASFAQSSFTRDSVIVVDGKTADQLYSLTKLFVATPWPAETVKPDKIKAGDYLFETNGQTIKNSNRITQHSIITEDKDAGIIVTNGTFGVTVYNAGVKIGEVYYRYTTKFMVKDGKCKVSLSDIITDGMAMSNALWEKRDFSPMDAYPGAKVAGINEKNWNSLMASIKERTLPLVEQYATAITSQEAVIDW